MRLDYFKKGIRSFLQVSGKGWVVCDPEEMNSLEILGEEINATKANDMVLVKVKILKAEYYDTKPTSRNSWWQNTLTAFLNWLHNNNYGRQIYYPAS